MNTGKKLFLCAGLLAFFLSVSAQSYSLRTNVIGLATTNLNLEASMTLNRKWSLHLPVQYNPFKVGRNRQFRNFYAAPGVRYWLLESYMGGFIGMHVRYGRHLQRGEPVRQQVPLRGGRLRSRFKYREGLPDRQALEP